MGWGWVGMGKPVWGGVAAAWGFGGGHFEGPGHLASAVRQLDARRLEFSSLLQRC